MTVRELIAALIWVKDLEAQVVLITPVYQVAEGAPEHHPIAKLEEIAGYVRIEGDGGFRD